MDDEWSATNLAIPTQNISERDIYIYHILYSNVRYLLWISEISELF